MVGRHNAAAQQRDADDATQSNGANLCPCGRHGEGDDRGDDRERRAFPVGRKRARHAEHGLSDDGDGGDLEAVKPGAARRIAERFDTEGEQDEGERGGQREGGPCGQGARVARAREPDRHADLAAGGTRQELAQRHEIGVGALVEPLAPRNELLAEVAEVRDGTAKRGQPQTQEDEEDLADARSLRGRRGKRIHGHVGPRRLSKLQLRPR
jgi:hypothetical protein